MKIATPKSEKKKAMQDLHKLAIFSLWSFSSHLFEIDQKIKRVEKMTPLLFMVLAVEMGIIMILLFHSPFRNLIMMGLDRLKQGRGLVTLRTVAATLFVVFVFNVYGIIKTQKRMMEAGATNPTDQVLQANHILEASLMGFCLFLGLMIDRLHYYVKELWLLRRSLKPLFVIDQIGDSASIQTINKNK
uniref:uncharacterized protein LOC122601600 n=1 Tax=Erigeron canadensis TaxID=72917 RepID=UPI001CB963F8|nr:uncharacterized protein LOC122601600 [Erigeron canadensis]